MKHAPLLTFFYFEKNAPLLTATVQRVRGGHASVAEPNQEAGARAGRRRCGVHGTWAGELTNLHYTSLGLRRWAGRALRCIGHWSSSDSLTARCAS